MPESAELPHTGLHVPHTRLCLAGPGLLNYDDRFVGEIGIGGDGREVFVPAVHPPVLTADDVYDYAAGCRTPDGDPIDADDLFAYLRAEYRTWRALTRAALANQSVVQAMTPHGAGYLPGMVLHVDPDDTRQYVTALIRAAGQPAGTWWRIYNGTEWSEIELSEGVAA